MLYCVFGDVELDDEFGGDDFFVVSEFFEDFLVVFSGD